MMRYRGNLKVDRDYTVLGQQYKRKNRDVELALECGGYSLLDGFYCYNYRIQDDNLLPVYDTNLIRMVFPPEVTTDRIEGIKTILKVFHDASNIDIYSMYGGWINTEGVEIIERNNVLEFRCKLSDIRLEWLTGVMDNIKFEYGQDSTALYINDALILI